MESAAGGGAGAGGYNFQAAATALAYTHVLTGRPLNWLVGRRSVPLKVEAETGGPSAARARQETRTPRVCLRQRVFGTFANSGERTGA